MKSLTGWWDKLLDAYENRYQPEGVRVLAYFYWYTLLSIAVLVVSMTALYGYFQFSAITSGSREDIAVPEAATKPPITREEIKAVLRDFEERYSRYEMLKQTPLQVSDPSR